MKPLSEQAAEHLQEQYRQTLHYAVESLATSAINIFAKEKLPEPQYKERYTESVYYEELIATMDYLHEQQRKSKTVQLKDYFNEQNIKLTAGQVREILNDIFGESNNDDSKTSGL